MKPMDPVTFATLLALAASAGAAPPRDAARDGDPAAFARWVANAGDARSVDERESAPRRMGAEAGHAAATLGDGSRSLRGSWASDPIAAVGAFGSLETSRASRAPARKGPHPTAMASDTARGAKRPTGRQVADNTPNASARELRAARVANAGLLDAARGADLAAIESLLANGADPNTKDEHGYTPLHFAAERGDVAAIGILVGAGSDLQAQAVYGFRTKTTGETPLHLAARHDHGDAVGALLAAGVDANALAANGHPALHWAVETGAMAAIEALLAAGADPNLRAQDNSSHPPMHWAAWFGHARAIEALAAAGADPNTNVYGETPLSFAIRNGQGAAIAALVAVGVDIHTQKLPLHAVAKQGYREHSCRNAL